MFGPTATIALIALAVQAAAAAAPRQQMVACLKQTVEKAKSDKLKPDAFTALARSKCAAQLDAFKQSLVNFDVKNGVAQNRAEEDAELQIEDYLAGAAEKIGSDS